MNTQKKHSPNGWVCLDKPEGMLSMRATQRVKNIFHAHKAGHAGTLDPFASGLLPIALGEATKTIPYLVDSMKSYDFTICWGKETDSDDLKGTLTQTSDKRPTEEEILYILKKKFTGEIQQTPPDYSAAHSNGERAYSIARRGEKPILLPRTRFIKEINLLDMHDKDHSCFRACTGKGVYIRSIARDLGRLLGCYGHLSRLRRIHCGRLQESDAISLDALQEMVHTAQGRVLLPLTYSLEGILEISVSGDQARALRQGRKISLSSTLAESSSLKEGDVTLMVRKEKQASLMQEESFAIGLARFEKGAFQPTKIFNILIPGE